MKKWTAMILILACFLALAGCKPAQPRTTTAAPNTTAATQAPPPTTQAPPATTQAVDPDAIPMGTIFITEALQQALDTSEDENEEFAVVVTTMPGVTKEHVYDTFVKPLNVQEDYTKWGIVYMTAEQIAAARCPSDYWLVFILGATTYKGMWITHENLYRITTDTRTVRITCNVSDDAGGQFQQVQDQILEAYGISKDMVIFSSDIFNRFEVKLDTSLITTMLTDPRIKFIDDWEDSTQKDQGGGGTPDEASKSPIISIRDRLKENQDIGYELAMEKIFEDGDDRYYLSGLYSQHIIVYYRDGTTEDIKTALNAGRATIADLDAFGIAYSKKPW